MKQIFLGSPWHWLWLILACVVLWVLGEQKLHVINFNQFLGLLVGLGFILVISVIFTSKPSDEGDDS